jgi:glycosyltransferase involved in cell wall biosynthesis
MRVCLLSPRPYPPDSRLALEARGLLDAGHDTVVLCRSRASQDGEGSDGSEDAGDTEAGREMGEGLDVDRLPVDDPPFDSEDSPQAIGAAAGSTHSAWESGLERLDRELPIDAIGVQGLALAKTGLEAGEDLGVPVVLDFDADPVARLAHRREIGEKRSLLTQPGALAARVRSPLRRLRRLEASAISRADRIVVASEEARARYVRDREISPEKIRVVQSTVDLATFDAASAQTPVGLDFSPDSDFTIAYPGPLVPERGLETLLDAFAQLGQAVPDARVVFPGRGPEAYVDSLRERAERAGVAERVTFATRADPEDLPAHLALCDVAVLPFPENEYAASALPGALFESFAAGTPMIVGDISPLRRVLTRADAGLVATDSHTDLAAALRVLRRNPDRAADLGANGRRAVEPGGAFDAARDRVAIARAYADL